MITSFDPLTVPDGVRDSKHIVPDGVQTKTWTAPQTADTVGVMADRKGYKIFVSPEEKAKLDAYLKSIGVEHNVALTKIIRWMMASDPAIRMGILELIDAKYNQEVAVIAIAKLGGVSVKATDSLLNAVQMALTEIQSRPIAAEIAADPKSPAKKIQPARRRKADGAA